MRKKAWPPYVAGIVIGLLMVPAFLIVGSALGASSCYVSAAGYIASLFDASVREMDYFGKYMTSMKYLWQGSMVIGIVIGAWISRTMSGAKRQPFSPIWRRAMGAENLPQRMAAGFIGGFVLLFGARWAGGCTSGHGLSGGGQLAVGSLVVIVCMFAGGILVANLFRRV